MNRFVPFLAGAAIVLPAFFAMPAVAADLGGDCCADLEERIAELEATTVRKGNRKVSLKLSGHISTALFYFDNGDEQNAYVADVGSSRSRFRLTGKAKFKPGWSAGFNIEIGLNATSTLGVRVDDDDGGQEGDQQLLVRKSYWWIKSKQFGRIAVGQNSEVNDGLFHIDLSGTALPAYASVGWGNDIVFGGTATRIDAVFRTIDGGRRNIVRYDSPNVAGFTFSANWGEDDIWGVALRYKASFNGLKIAAGIGYDENTDEIASGISEQNLQGSLSVLHDPTGLFVTFAYGDVTDNGGADRDLEQWHVKAGIYKRFISLGKTAIYGEYSEIEQTGTAAVSDGTRYGLGINQKINNAGMEIYAGYRHYEADDLAAASDVDLFITGARIKF